MYSKYMDIAFNPDKYLQEQWQAPGEMYDYHYLIDMTGDGISEVVFLGTPKSICIMGENNVITLGGDEIFWSEEPNVFYVDVSYPGEFTLQKYELVVDENGYISAKLLDSEYLKQVEKTNDYLGNTLTFWMQGEEIWEEDYWYLLDKIKSAHFPRPKMYDADEFIASKRLFKRSAQRLTDEVI